MPEEAYFRALTRFVLPLICLLMAWAALVVFRAAFARRDVMAMMVFSAFLMAVVFGVHDIPVLRTVLDDGHVMLNRLSAPFLMDVVTAVLLWRFAETINRLDQFNTRLRCEISAAEGALRRSFSRAQEQERTTTLQTERLRLMGDLHDGIAGQLVVILSMSEQRTCGTADLADTARAALVDLRLVVASLDDYGNEPGAMLGVLRERIEPQISAHGMALAWRMTELPGLHPGAVLTIYRIFQEATTNACRHSGASRVASWPDPLRAAGLSH